MGFNDEFALQKILNGPCPLWVLAVVISFVLRRAGNCHSARLQAHPHRLINRTTFFLEKNFLEKPDSQMRRQGRNRRQVPLPDKSIGVGTTTFRAALEMRGTACGTDDVLEQLRHGQLV